METTEFCPLSKEALIRLLEDRPAVGANLMPQPRRRVPRWPFPAMVELWLPSEDGSEVYSLGTCENLSVQGAGIRFDEPVQPGVELSIAIHRPEKTFHGRAVVRHCTRMHMDYYIGVEFLFDKS